MTEERTYLAPTEFDRKAAQRFLAEVLAEIEEEEGRKGKGGRVVLDFSAVHYISSAGVGATLRLYRECRMAGWDVIAVVPDSEIRAVLEVAGIDRLMKIVSEPPKKNA